MANEKMIKIATSLLEKSRKGEIAWEETSDQDTYLASFPSYSVQLVKATDWLFILSIVDSKGRRLDSLRSGDEGIPDSVRLNDLFEMARHRALSVDVTLDDVLENLTGPTSKSAHR